MPLRSKKRIGSGKALDRPYGDVKAEAMERLRRAKLALLPRPAEQDDKPVEPRLPNDITKLSNQGLGKLYGQFAAMASYAGCMGALADIDYTIKSMENKHVRARLHAAMEGRGKQDWRRAQVELDPAVLDATKREMVAEATSLMVASVLETYIKGRDACSREISRRTELEPRERNVR